MRMLIVSLALIATGCASTSMKGYLGKPIEEAFMTQGQPEHVFDLPDGRRVFQFKWGGGSAVVPARTNATIRYEGPVTTVVATGTPAMIVSSEGCLVSLIAEKTEGGYVVREYRIPKRLVC